MPAPTTQKNQIFYKKNSKINKKLQEIRTIYIYNRKNFQKIFVKFFSRKFRSLLFSVKILFKNFTKIAQHKFSKKSNFAEFQKNGRLSSSVFLLPLTQRAHSHAAYPYQRFSHQPSQPVQLRRAGAEEKEQMRP